MRDYNFQDMLISKETTIKTAMKKLDTVASKILFVTDDNKKLIGSLTDGDIRRYILSNGSLDSTANEACNKNSHKIHTPYDESDVLKEMEHLGIVFSPVINKYEIIEDIISYSSISKKIIRKVYKKIDIPVVIMAGGKGTRMKPFTNVLPKPLIPIGNKTMIDYIIDEYRHYMIKDFFITINYKANLIKAYFEGTNKDYNINYIKEDKFFGTAGSLKLLDKIPETFFVSNCDIIVKVDYSDVLRFHKKSKSILTIISSIQHHAIPYGVVEFESGGHVSHINEKPELSMPINTGVYILEKEACNYIPENEFFHMTHLIEKLIKNGKNVMTYPVNEKDYIDIGQWDEYKKSINMFV